MYSLVFGAREGRIRWHGFGEGEGGWVCLALRPMESGVFF